MGNSGSQYTFTVKKRLMESNNNEIEVSLIGILKKVTGFFKRYIVFFIIATCIGAALGVLKTFINKPVYRANLIATSAIMNTEDIISILNKCKMFIDEDNYQALGKLLKLDSSDAAKIIKIQVKSSIIPRKIKNEKEKDLDDNLVVAITNKFSIEVDVLDSHLFAKLSTSIPELIRDNQYAKLRTQLTKYTQKNVLDRIQTEIKQLDSLKKSLSPGLVTGKSTFYVANPSSIHESIIRLYEQQMGIYASLSIPQDLIIIEDFTVFKTPYNKNLSFYTLNVSIFASIAFGIAILFAFYKEISKVLVKIIE